MLQVIGHNQFAEQAVNLLILYMGIFYAHTLGYWRLPIRKLKSSRIETITCSSVYGDRFLFAPKITLMLQVMTKLVLSKESSEIEIKRYFNAVLELSKSDNEFPINLDEVWMLVYSDKGKAVRALKENFIEGVDYSTFTKNGKTDTGGYKVIEYNLTVSCMEFYQEISPEGGVLRQDPAKREHADHDAGSQVARHGCPKAQPETERGGNPVQPIRAMALEAALRLVGTARNPDTNLHPFRRLDRNKHLHRMDGERKTVHPCAAR